MRYVAAVASLADGTILTGTREVCDSLGLHTTQRDDFRQRLFHTIKDLCSRIGTELGQVEDIALCIGMAGVNYEYDSEVELPGELARCGLKMRLLACTGDIEIVLASHVRLVSKPASGIICNMGSTAFARNSTGQITRVGGWGPAIGDDGSGFEMGKAALRAVGEELDRGEGPSVLWKTISDWLASPDESVGSWHSAACEWRCHLAHYLEKMGAQADSRRAICSFVHKLELRGCWRPVASGLTIPLIRASQHGDRRAIAIVKRAAAGARQQF